MAEAREFVCNHCGHSEGGWSDGNPYYIDEHGKKQYAYHPRHDLLALCIGNDSNHLCLDCGNKFLVDSRAPITTCPKCNSHDFECVFDLDGKRCPVCKNGTFRIDPTVRAIS